MLSDDLVYIGTSKGQLLVYRIVGQEPNLSVDLVDTKKAFAKKGLTQLLVYFCINNNNYNNAGITQLNAVAGLNVLVSLCDGYVSIHSLTTLEQIARIEKSKGCAFYAIDLQIRGLFPLLVKSFVNSDNYSIQRLESRRVYF